jgi:hypothetical protein
MGGLVTAEGERRLYRYAELIDAQQKRAGHLTYTVDEKVNQELWNVVELEYVDIFERHRDLTLTQARESATVRVENVEVAGKIYGPMHREDWIDQELEPLRAAWAMREELYQLVRAVPHNRDRLAAARRRPRFAAIPEAENAYLNWSHFAHALGETARGASALLQERLVRLAREAAEAGTAPRAAPRPPRRGAPAVPSDAQALLDELLAVCRVAPVRALRPYLTALEREADEAVQRRIVAVYESLGTQDASRQLAAAARRTDWSMDLRVAALLALGRIGRPYAIRDCKSMQFVEPASRAAQTAALVLAGDKEELATLPGTYRQANVEAQRLLFDHVLESSAPAKVLALKTLGEEIAEPARREAIALGLAGQGGLTAAQALAEMIRADARLYVDALRRTPSRHTTPLVRPLARILRGASQDKCAAAVFLGMSANPLAADHLSASAATDREACGAVGLALLGSPDALKEAERFVDRLDLNSVRVIRRMWQDQGQLHQPWRWRDGVDTRAAAEFMRRAATESERPHVRLGAAFTLLEMGEKPDLAALIALASAAETLPAAPAGPREDMPPGPPPPYDRPATPAPETFKGIPDRVVTEAQRYRFLGAEAEEEEAPETTARTRPRPRPQPRPKAAPKLDPNALPFGVQIVFEPTPAEFALKVLDPVADESVLDDLRRLAREGATVPIRTRAMWTLGRLKDETSVTLLNKLFLTRMDRYETLEALVQDGHRRAGAARALGRAGHMAAVPLLLRALDEPPPAQTAVGTPEAPVDEQTYDRETARWRAILSWGVCDALGALCAAEPDAGPSGLPRAQLQRLREDAALALVKLAAHPGKGYAQIATEERGARLAAVLALGKIQYRNRRVTEPLWLLADTSTSDVTPELRQAAMEALIRTRDAATMNRLRAKLPELMRDTAVRGLFTGQIPALLASGRASDLALLGQLMPYLEPDAQSRVADRILAPAPGKEQPREPLSPQAEAARIEILFGILSSTRPTGPSGSGAGEDRLRWFRLRRRCLHAVAQAPNAARRLRQIADDPALQNEVAVLLAKLDPGYNSTQVLLDRARNTREDMAVRRGALSALRGLGTDAAFRALREIMLGPLATEDQEEIPHPEPEPARLAARMLGEAGRVEDLKEAFAVERRDLRTGKVYYRFPAAKSPAIYGMGWLPLKDDPLALLRRYRYVAKSDAGQAAIAEAMDILKRRMAAQATDENGEGGD